MKKIALIVVLGSVSFCTAVYAEREGSQHTPPAGEPGGEHGDRPSFRRFGGASQGEGEYVDRWLESLKQRNPEEFERAKKLRQENPEEFRKHLHKKLEEMRTKGGQPGGSLREHPAIIEALKNLPQEEREWAMQRLQQPAPIPGRSGEMPMRGDGFPDLKNPYSPEMQRTDEQLRALGDKFRKAGTDDERVAVKKELRATLAILFDQREKARTEALRQMEDKFSKLRQQMDERAKDREKIIDSYLEEKIRGEMPKR